jgi:hypothetical protein
MHCLNRLCGLVIFECKLVPALGRFQIVLLRFFVEMFCNSHCGCIGPLQLRCVHTGEVVIMERCQQYSRTAQSGLLCYVYPCENIEARLSLRIIQLDVTVETKTKDNVSQPTKNK